MAGHSSSASSIDHDTCARRSTGPWRAATWRHDAPRGGLWRFWQLRGHLHAARRRTDAVLAMPGVAEQAAGTASPSLRGRRRYQLLAGRLRAPNALIHGGLQAAREAATTPGSRWRSTTSASPRSTLSIYAGRTLRRRRAYAEQRWRCTRSSATSAASPTATGRLAIATPRSGDLATARQHAIGALESYRRSVTHSASAGRRTC